LRVSYILPESAGTLTAVVSSEYLSAIMLLQNCDYCSLQHDNCKICRHRRNCEELCKRISRKINRVNTL